MRINSNVTVADHSTLRSSANGTATGRASALLEPGMGKKCFRPTLAAQSISAQVTAHGSHICAGQEAAENEP